MSRSTTILLTTLVLLGFAEPAFACAVCFDANDETRDAFVGTTILLSLLPLGLMGGLVYWLFRRARAVDDQPSPG